MTTINDIVLIHHENKPLSFARIESITPDVKPDWYHVELLLFQIPLQTVTWILRDVYIDGDPFTMGGKEIRLEKIVSPSKQTHEDSKNASEEKPSHAGKSNVISFLDKKK
jgi:hypothetical protein